jgi:hypothetical protein
MEGSAMADAVEKLGAVQERRSAAFQIETNVLKQASHFALKRSLLLFEPAIVARSMKAGSPARLFQQYRPKAA